MFSLSRSSIVLGLVLAVVACKDSTGPERVTPTSIEKIAGDQQQAVRGNPLPSPLRVRVLGSNGRPLAGMAVDWSAPDASTTFESSRTTTDASGEAETRVTVLGAVGPVEIRAAVSGIAPATFASEGLDPCYFDYAPTLNLGTSRSGVLSLLDCFFEGWSSDLYVFSVQQQQAVSLRVRAAGFDPVVAFYPFTGWRLALWDTVNATRDAHFKAIVPAGTYGLQATSFDANVTGAYEASVSAISESAEGCEFVLVLVGISTRQQLTSTDCGLESEPRADLFSFALFAGERVRITLSSTAFAPWLKLRLFDGTVVAENDGSASGTAIIDVVAEEPLAGYVVHASSTNAAAAGEYELVIAEGIMVGSTSAQRAPGAQKARRAAGGRGVSLFSHAP